MGTVNSMSSTDHGTTCTKCGRTLSAAEWFEPMSDGLVHYLWWCNCDNKFETSINCPVDTEAKLSEKDWEEMLPPLLVA